MRSDACFIISELERKDAPAFSSTVSSPMTGRPPGPPRPRLSARMMSVTATIDNEIISETMMKMLAGLKDRPMGAGSDLAATPVTAKQQADVH